jgi:hypothetical protein
MALKGSIPTKEMGITLKKVIITNSSGWMYWRVLSKHWTWRGITSTGINAVFSCSGLHWVVPEC